MTLSMWLRGVVAGAVPRKRGNTKRGNTELGRPMFDRSVDGSVWVIRCVILFAASVTVLYVDSGGIFSDSRSKVPKFW